eukprot:403345620
MKALQNFVVRTKVYLMKDSTRLNELNHPHNPQQQGVNSAFHNKPGHHYSTFRQRQLLAFRPFQKLLSFSYENVFTRYMLFVDHQRRQQLDELLKKQRQSLLESEQQQDQQIQPSHFEGILEIFNSPPEGSKQFCGKVLELRFFHTVESTVGFKDLENASMYSSHYSIVEQGDELRSIYFDNDSMNGDALSPQSSQGQLTQQINNTEYLRQRGENLLGFTECQSQYIYTIHEEEGESGSSEEFVQVNSNNNDNHHNNQDNNKKGFFFGFF